MERVSSLNTDMLTSVHCRAFCHASQRLAAFDGRLRQILQPSAAASSTSLATASVTAAALVTSAACKTAAKCVQLVQVLHATQHDIQQALGAAQLALGAGRAALEVATCRAAAIGQPVIVASAGALLQAEMILLAECACAVDEYGGGSSSPHWELALPAAPLLSWMAAATGALAVLPRKLHGG